MVESLLEDILDRLGAHFSRLVVKGFTVGIQHQNVGDIALVVLLDQLLLLGRAAPSSDQRDLTASATALLP